MQALKPKKMNLKAIDAALDPIRTNADRDETLGVEIEALANDPNNGPQEFRTALSQLGNDLRRSNITLNDAVQSLVNLVNKILDAKKQISPTTKSLIKSVKSNIKTDLNIANEVDALLDTHHEEIPDEVLERIDEILAEIRMENPKLLDSPQKIKNLMAAEARSDFGTRARQILLTAGLALSAAQVGSCIQDKTDQSPIEWVVNWVFSSPSDSQ